MLLVLVFTVSLRCDASGRPASPTRIVLDPTTFPEISRPLLQDTADQVAKTVDELIPGSYPHMSSSTILCFVANGKWGNMPRAVIGKPWKIEPPEAYKYEMRVALTPSVLPGAWQRLAFQLAHELTHLKMDGSVDNNAMEAFATAVSLEALHRLDYDPYREANERYYTQWNPPQVMMALKKGEWNKVALYLRYELRHENVENWDRGSHFIAAQYCPLSPSSLEGFPDPVKTLLAPDPMNVVMVHTSENDLQDGGLTFKEKGKWVALRWRRRDDPLMPDGFVPMK